MSVRTRMSSLLGTLSEAKLEPDREGKWRSDFQPGEKAKARAKRRVGGFQDEPMPTGSHRTFVHTHLDPGAKGVRQVLRKPVSKKLSPEAQGALKGLIRSFTAHKDAASRRLPAPIGSGGHAPPSSHGTRLDPERKKAADKAAERKTRQDKIRDIKPKKSVRKKVAALA